MPGRQLQSALFGIVMTLALVSCGGGGSSSVDSTSTSSTGTPPPPSPPPPPPQTPSDPMPTPGLLYYVAGQPGLDMENATGAALRQVIWHRPMGLAIAPDRTIYVADAGSNTIRSIRSGVVSTYAGNIARGCGRADGPLLEARFCEPTAIVLDAEGSLYVNDAGNKAVRKITTSGQVTTLAVLNTSVGPSGTYATSTGLNGLAVDKAGNVHLAVCSPEFAGIYRIAPQGTVNVFVGGAPAEFAVVKDGKEGDATFLCPQGLAFSPTGVLFVADAGGRSTGGVSVMEKSRYNAIRQIASDGTVSTVSGRYEFNGQKDGALDVASFEAPNDLAFDKQGNLYVTDVTSLRKIQPDGQVVTVGRNLPNASDGWCEPGPGGNCNPFNKAYLAVDPDGQILVSEYGRQALWRLDAGNTFSLFSGVERKCCTADGLGADVIFDSQPLGLAGTSFGLAISDGGSLRLLNALGSVSTLASANLTGVYPFGYPLFSPSWASMSQRYSWYGHAIAATPNGDLLWSVTQGPEMAGLFQLAASSWGAPPIASVGQAALALVKAPTGTVYAILPGRNAIYSLTANGDFQIWAGRADSVCRADDGTGPTAGFCNPSALAVDSSGHLLVSDSGNHTLRRIDAAARVTTLAGQPGVPGTRDGPAGQSQFSGPGALATDSSGNVYVADTGNFTIRKVDANGGTITVAGTPGQRGMSTHATPARRLPAIDGLALVGTDLYFSARGAPTPGCKTGCVVNNGLAVIRKTP